VKKKPPTSPFSHRKAAPANDDKSWHNGADVEINLYARSLQKAAKTLIETFDAKINAKAAWDAAPVVLLYRHPIELHLKALVGEGASFLPSTTDHLTLYKTHSLRWLAQLVCQIIRGVGWEKEFKCEGVVQPCRLQCSGECIRRT